MNFARSILRSVLIPVSFFLIVTLQVGLARVSAQVQAGITEFRVSVNAEEQNVQQSQTIEYDEGDDLKLYATLKAVYTGPPPSMGGSDIEIRFTWKLRGGPPGTTATLTNEIESTISWDDDTWELDDLSFADNASGDWVGTVKIERKHAGEYITLVAYGIQFQQK